MCGKHLLKHMKKNTHVFITQNRNATTSIAARKKKKVDGGKRRKQSTETLWNRYITGITSLRSVTSGMEWLIEHKWWGKSGLIFLMKGKSRLSLVENEWNEEAQSGKSSSLLFYWMHRKTDLFWELIMVESACVRSINPPSLGPSSPLPCIP